MSINRRHLLAFLAATAIVADAEARAAKRAAPTTSTEAAASARAGDMSLDRFTQLFTAKGEDLEARYTRMENLRGSAQASLERLLKKGRSLDLELRYAELVLQRARDLDQFALELEVRGQGKRADELKRVTKSLFEKGLALNGKLLPSLKGHPLASKVFLGLGRTELGLGRKGQALTYADRGLGELSFVRESERNDASLQLWILKGDVAFDLAKAAQALEAYQRAEKFLRKGGLEEAYLSYRLAWTQYNLKNAGKAIEQLEHLVEVSRDSFALRQEAVQDYALFAADLSDAEFKQKGELEGMFKYLARAADEESALKSFDRLAKTYSKTGRRDLASKTLLFLIERAPEQTESLERALTYVEWSHTLAEKKELVRRYLWLLKDFGPGSRWYDAHALKPDIQKLASAKISSLMRKFSVTLHQESQREPSDELRKKAEDIVAALYDEQIKSFPDFHRIYFYRAEIHRRRETWAEAGKHYDTFLNALVNVPPSDWDATDKKQRDEASIASVQVWAKATEADMTHAKSLLAAADKFLIDNPKHPLAAKVALDAARVEVKTTEGSLALRRLEKLVEEYPHTKEASLGVHAALDYFGKQNDWISLAGRARFFLDRLDLWAEPAEKAKLRAELTQILSKTEAKACESLSTKSGRELEAALCFKNFAGGFSKDELAPKALLMSSELFDKVLDPSAALESLEALVKKYPDSSQAATAFSKLASAFERTFEFEKAADVYEVLMQKEELKAAEREKIAERYLRLLSRLGQTERLEKAFGMKHVPEAVKARFQAERMGESLARIREEEARLGYHQGKFASAVAEKEFALFEKTSKLDPISVMELHRIRGNRLQSRNELDKADHEWMNGLKYFWKMSGKTPEAWDSAARLRLDQGKFWEAIFKRMTAAGNPRRKIELFKKLEAWYTEVISMKSRAMALEALARSSKLYREFGAELKTLSEPEAVTQGNALVLAATELDRQKATKAAEWKIFLPSMAQTTFAWPTLPLWLDLAKEDEGWEEWKLSDSALNSKLAKADKLRRSELRRVVLVSLSRQMKLNSEVVQRWSRALTDRLGVQLRIQAMLRDPGVSSAQTEMYIEQYRDLFGADDFAESMRAELDYKKGLFTEAFERFLNPRNKKSFRLTYVKEGWLKQIRLLAPDDRLELKARETAGRDLQPLVATVADRELFLNLCLKDEIECDGGVTRKLASELLGHLSPAFYTEGAGSLLELHAANLEAYLSLQLKLVKSPSELESLKPYLAGFGHLRDLAQNKETQRKLRTAQDGLQSAWKLLETRLNAEAKQDVVAGVE